MSKETPQQRLQELMKDRSIAYFVYFMVIIASGHFFLTIVTDIERIHFGSAVLYMIAWAGLIIALKPPEAARPMARPFEQVGIAD